MIVLLDEPQHLQEVHPHLSLRPSADALFLDVHDRNDVLMVAVDDAIKVLKLLLHGAAGRQIVIGSHGNTRAPTTLSR